MFWLGLSRPHFSQITFYLTIGSAFGGGGGISRSPLERYMIELILEL
jgi:hypothetical protein